MIQAVHIWRNNSDRLVGYRNTARKHILLENGKYIYGRSFEYEELGNSMVLPSGMIYHRDFLRLYMEDSIRRSREIVDESMNCDDILFNFVAANYTKKPPILLGKLPFINQRFDC